MADERSGHKKRKWDTAKHHQHGSNRGGRKSRDMGRGEWSRTKKDRRAQNNEEDAKRRRASENGEWTSTLPKPFPEEEIAAEERRPKHKVAVMLSYSGSGYKGMQISPTERTIEGDLFTAFVAAGAVSKANANDPKKSSLVRCARTDKGVHAAGNVINLKLIVEDPDIIAKINENLSPQIRVWGYERTTGSFSCYQACDSRWYEYLIPSHSFLPPHPGSWLAGQLDELARDSGDGDEFKSRQEEVAGFWPEIEEKYVRPILQELNEDTRALVEKALSGSEWAEGSGKWEPEESEVLERDGVEAGQEGNVANNQSAGSSTEAGERAESNGAMPTSGLEHAFKKSDSNMMTGAAQPEPGDENSYHRPTKKTRAEIEAKCRLEAAIKSLKACFIAAKRAYRIHPTRMERVSSALKQFLGTKNFHNYTIQKTFRDPSAKRVIKSFVLDPETKIINGTEWLSIKIHGQSFMMHQIRKMIGMVALVVRCGCPISRISETFDNINLSIPKAPGLGLLLERPVFESYNEGAAVKFNRPRITFEKYEAQMREFKQREIYDRIHQEEREGNHFHVFFTHVDHYKDADFLYLSSKGVAAAKPATKREKEPVSRRVRSTGANAEPTGKRVWTTGVDSDDEIVYGDGEEEG